MGGTTPRRVVIACGVFEPELEALRVGDSGIEVRYLDQNLHRTPEDMPALIQAEVDDAAAYASELVLGYGLCSNGVVGVRAPAQGLFIPRVHDCISLFLGSARRYAKLVEEEPGVYYLTPGWVATAKDPIGVVEADYTPRVGREDAIWTMNEELKHYTKIAFINTGIGNGEALRQRTVENARFFGKEFGEIPGSNRFFEKILFGPYTPTDFICLARGQVVEQDHFFSDMPAV
jgi:hypothetical protein